MPIRDAVRTGDTSAFERNRMRKSPPHILVTTPESLFILLTSESGRAMLKSTKSVIVDELHSVAGSKRGSHLMLSLERLDALCGKPPVRVGLSATVKPLEDMARFLVGDREADVEIVDTGHVRERDLALELPRSPLEAIMANEVWDELYDRLAELIQAHRTTLIFVNNRRLAERATRFLAERIGAEHVACHHGSLSKEHRLSAETRLKAGELKALIATSSLELGIDIGDIDLVCQMGSPRLISAFLQRVGRAGHAIGAIPKGRLFPLSLDDLVECTALLDGVRRGELDKIRVPRKPLDVLSQQIVAEVACREWGVDELLAAFRRAQPYADLTAEEFEQVLQMLAEGYSTRRGRRSAYLHYDTVNRRLRPRKGARLTAVTNAGVIPDQFDYDVVLNPEGFRIGSVGEDFAFESMPGDIFQLGNTSYRVQKVEVNKIFVEDARGMAPTLPFWVGEAPARSDELSAAVSRLRADALGQLADGGPEGLEAWLRDEKQLDAVAAQQLAQYLAAGQAALGTLPTLDTIVFERFFDDVGDTHLVIHSTFGSRINRAWGLALRKRFCRQFNFELQASALEDSIVLSLGPTHSFPLEDVKAFLKSDTAEDVLVQALLDAPVFGTRWRWDAAIALALVRNRNGKRMPAPFQRADSEDLLAVVFPDQLACAENLTGKREIPDHPLVKQSIDDCLREFMDVDGFLALLRRIEDGSLQVECRDLSAPSPLSHAVLGARPYAFLDDGDAEGRRTRSVSTDRLLDPKDAADLGRLDPAAIEKVKAEAWPEIGNARRAARRARGVRLPDRARDRAVEGAARAAAGRAARDLPRRTLARRRALRRVRAREGRRHARARGDRAQPPRAGRPGDGNGAPRRARPAGRRHPRRPPRPRIPGLDHARPVQRRARGRMVRAAPADPHPPLHPRPQAQRDPGRAARAVHALPVPLAAGGDGGARRSAGRRGRIARRAAAARRVRDSGRRLGAGHPAAAGQELRAVGSRQALRGRADRVGSAGRGERQRDRAGGRAGAVDADHAGRAGGAGALAAERRGVGIGRGLVGARRRRFWRACGSTAPRSSTTSCTTRDSCAATSRLALGELVSRGRVTSDSFAGVRALITSKKRRERLRQYRRPFLSLEDAGAGACRGACALLPTRMRSAHPR